MRQLFRTAMILGFISTAACADICTSSLNLVTNCGFETGTLAGWSLSGTQSSPAYEGISYGVDTSDANSGKYGAYLGGYGGYLSVFQSVAATPGTTYQISYYLAQAPATPSPYTSGFSTYFDGLPLVVSGDAPLEPFTLYTFDAKATTSLSTLTFNARDDTGYYSLDDVSVVAVPEPAAYILSIPLLYIFVRRTQN